METKHRSLAITLVVVVGVLMIGFLALLSGRPGADGASVAAPSEPAASTDMEAQQPPGEGEPPAAPSQEDLEAFLLSLAKRDPADPAAVGRVDAPIVMTEWADFRCPFCSVFAEDTLPGLQHYIDAGLLRFEFRDLAIFGDESVYAAVAARAAGEQDKHHEFMRALYETLPNDGHPAVDEAIVTQVAEQVGVADLERFLADLDSAELENAVLVESFEAQQLGLGSVPSFVVGTQVVQGAQPLEYFEQVIEQELAKARG